jgi:hypothetical protein
MAAPGCSSVYYSKGFEPVTLKSSDFKIIDGFWRVWLDAETG